MQNCIKNWKHNLTDFSVTTKLTKKTQDCITYSGYLTKILEDQAKPSLLKLSVLSQKTNERIIAMSVKANPWTYAHSYFTLTGCNYFGDDLVNLGNDTLGNLIGRKKNSSHVTRTDFEYADGMENLELLIQYFSEFSLMLKSQDKNNCKSTSQTILASIVNRLNNLNSCIIRRSSFLLNDKIPLLTLYETFLPDLIHEFNNTGF